MEICRYIHVQYCVTPDTSKAELKLRFCANKMLQGCFITHVTAVFCWRSLCSMLFMW